MDYSSIEGVEEAADIALQQTRHDILHALMTHPQEMAAEATLAAFTGKSRSTVEGHLRELEEYRMIDRKTIPQGYRQRGCPSVFYEITDEGEDILERYDWLEDEKLETCRQWYDQPEGIPHYESVDLEIYIEAPRPPVTE